ncbi:MAG: hypothetical protein IPP77_12050 [Bacteroidetes bacterium]|nr:hypothetical protein [Bacteroidota bacterium]
MNSVSRFFLVIPKTILYIYNKIMPMQEEEIAYYRNEIARLNAVITALLKYNELLNVEIAHAKTGERLPDEGMVHAETGKPLPNEEMVDAKTGKPFRDMEMVHANTYIGNHDVTKPLAETHMGNLSVTKPLAETYMGNPNLTKPLPTLIEPSPKMISALYSILKGKGFNKIRHGAIRNAAKLLIHFHNKKSGDHSELQKLTGLSRYGTAKFVASLKKRGLIVRNGWQQFLISSSAEAMIREAWEKTDGEGNL